MATADSHCGAASSAASTVKERRPHRKVWEIAESGEHQDMFEIWQTHLILKGMPKLHQFPIVVAKMLHVSNNNIQ